MASESSLLAAVLAELFQAERSGSKHPLVEAERLGDSPPAIAMQVVGAHATRALSELEVLSAERNVNVGALARPLGRTFSALRNRFADLGMRGEQSYRLTLLGIRHGVDLVRFLRYIALASEDLELARWTDQWLEERQQLLSELEKQLAWFARSPEKALGPVKHSVSARLARSLSQSFGKLDAALSRAIPKRV